MSEEVIPQRAQCDTQMFVFEGTGRTEGEMGAAASGGCCRTSMFVSR